MGTSIQQRFFGVATDVQSYINILYLFLSLPLGIAYFVFLVTGISLGIGLLVIWVGVPILAFVFAASWVLCGLERTLANVLLKEDISPTVREDVSGQVDARLQGLSPGERSSIGMWRRFKAHLSNRLTWTGMLSDPQVPCWCRLLRDRCDAHICSAFSGRSSHPVSVWRYQFSCMALGASERRDRYEGVERRHLWGGSSSHPNRHNSGFRVPAPN